MDQDEDNQSCESECVKKLETSRNCSVDWYEEEERCGFLQRLNTFISDWQGPLPDLRAIFHREEIDWLLIEDVKRSRKSLIREVPIIDFVIKCGYRDEPKVDQDGKPLLRRDTALHDVARNIERISRRNAEILSRFAGIDLHLIIRAFAHFATCKLFQIFCRFDVNYTDESGLSHFHVPCMTGCVDAVLKYLQHGQDPNCIWTKTGDSPLHLAAYYDHIEVARLLLRNGANPNWANANKSTPLHIICTQECDPDFVEVFFKICDDMKQTVQINVQDKLGNTPLHVALDCDREKAVVGLLMRKGADPNLANEEGLTPLHIVCQKEHNIYDLVEFFFKISKENNKQVNVDHQDNKGRTLLYWATYHNHTKVTELLLRNGANPNLADAEGSTPLHLICRKKLFKGSVLNFFRITKEMNQVVQVNVRDEKGRTPLQLAVTNLWPNIVTFLLDRGADLSNFVFPTESDFDEHFESFRLYHRYHTSMDKLKFEMIVDTYNIIKHLEKKGYELSRSDKVTIMKFFEKQSLFYIKENFHESWFDDQIFVKTTKVLMIKPNLSLYDLIRLRPEEAAKQFSHRDFIRTQDLSGYITHDVICKKISVILLRLFLLPLAPEPSKPRPSTKPYEIGNLRNIDLKRLILVAEAMNNQIFRGQD